MDSVTKEFNEVVTDRAFLISIVIQFLLISTLLFIYSTYANVSKTPITVKVALDKSNPSLEEKLKNAGVQVVFSNDSQPQNNAAPTAASPASITPARNQVVATINTEEKKVTTESNILSAFAISKIKQASEELSFEEALSEKGFSFSSSQPIEQTSELVQLGYGILIPISAMLPALIAMSLATQNIFMERKRKTIELLLVSPISDFELAFNKIMPLVLISSLCSFAWLFLVSQRIPLLNFSLLVFISFLISLFLVSLSVIISCKSKTVKEADGVSSIVGMVLMITLVAPHTPLTIYMPTIVLARTASNFIDFEIAVGLIAFIIFTILSFMLAVRGIGELRKNYS